MNLMVQKINKFFKFHYIFIFVLYFIAIIFHIFLKTKRKLQDIAERKENQYFFHNKTIGDLQKNLKPVILKKLYYNKFYHK